MRIGRNRVSAQALLSLGFALVALAQGAGVAGERPSLDTFLARCGYVKVEVKPGAGNHMLLTCTANGKKIPCMIDTGSVVNVIDEDRSPRVIRKVPADERPADGPLGKVHKKVPLVEIERFELDGLVVSNLLAVPVPLNDNNPTPRWFEKKDMILGMDFLLRQHALISFSGSSCLYLRGEAPDEKTAAVMKASLVASGLVAVPITGREYYRPLVEVSVNGKPATFLLDTGAACTLMDVAELRAHGVGARETDSFVWGAGGRSKLGLVKVPTLKIGGFELKNFLIGATPIPLGPKKGREWEAVGLLGPDVLGRGSAIIDCAAEVVYVKRGAG